MKRLLILALFAATMALSAHTTQLAFAFNVPDINLPGAAPENSHTLAAAQAAITSGQAALNSPSGSMVQ